MLVLKNKLVKIMAGTKLNWIEALLIALTRKMSPYLFFSVSVLIGRTNERMIHGLG